MKNNKIFPAPDYIPEPENQGYRDNPAPNSQYNFNSIIAGGISLFSSGFAFGITALSLDVDKTFHEAKNQTSFVKNLGEDGKYGFALAISALTFLTSFFIARNYLKKFDLQNNNQIDGTRVIAELGFGGGHPRTSPRSSSRPEGINRRSSSDNLR